MPVVSHHSTVVADHLLALAEANDHKLSPMQLLKLVYIAHGWKLGIDGSPLISDPIEAWQYGPVIPELYRRIRDFGDQPVRGPLVPAQPSQLDEDDIELVDHVYHQYGRKSGPLLSRLTHQPGSPWDITYRLGVRGARISNDLIEDHYAQLVGNQD